MYSIVRQERPEGEVLRQNEFEIIRDGSVVDTLEYLTFPALSETGMVRHLFTTRAGGVSEGIYRGLNLSFTRGDDPERVLENYRRAAAALGCRPEDVVCSHQTHTVNIRPVTEEDRGKGVVRPADYRDVDGLVTNVPGICLATVYADCVPLYFVDPVHRAVGLAHAGWRGTAAGMGARMVQTMTERFGTRPEDLLAAVGPSICWECYEVGGEVASVFASLERELAGPLRAVRKSGCLKPSDSLLLQAGREPGKYQLNLWLANLAVLHGAGVPLERISVTDICTCHNPEYLFSHRASHGKRGNLGAFLMLREARI